MLLQRSIWQVFWRFIKPEIEELIVYIVALVSFSVVAFYQVIVNNNTGSSEDIAGVFALISDNLQFITNGDDTIAKLFTFGLWFIIGTLIYALACFMISFAGGAFKDVEVSASYVHPSSFQKSDYWLSIISRAAIRVAAAFSLLFYVAVWCVVLAPVWLASFRGIFINGIHIESILDFVIAVIGIVLSLHVAAILIRLVLLRSSYSYNL